VALIDESAERAEAEVRKVYEGGGTPSEILERLVRGGVHQTVEQAHLLVVSSIALRELPYEKQQHALRRDRLNREEWAHLVQQVRPDLSDSAIRAMVLGVRGLMISIATVPMGLNDQQEEELAVAMILAALRAKLEAPPSGCHRPGGAPLSQRPVT
jgi:hypothetical protein